MGKIVFLLFAIVSIILGVGFIAIQIMYVFLHPEVIGAGLSFSFDIKYLFARENYFLLVLLIMLSLIADVIYVTFFRKSKYNHDKNGRRLTAEEKERYKDLATEYEAIKGLQRISFNSKGELNHIEFNIFEVMCFWIGFLILIFFIMLQIYFKNNLIDSFQIIGVYLLFWVVITLIVSRFHVRDYFDYCFDSVKKVYNNLLFYLKAKDDRKLNTLRTYKIGDVKTNRRGGLPFITKRRRMYIDPTDSHTIIIGTTNSGKTYSIIHPAIEAIRMAEENLLINDLKGELFMIHKAQLKEAGYDVKVLNFVDPSKSICWNPLGIVIKKYRKAQKDCLDLINRNEDYKLLYKNKINTLIKLEEINIRIDRNNQRIYTADKLEKQHFVQIGEMLLKELDKTQNELDMIEEQLPQPDFSEAFELLKDIANAMTYDANAKEPFWNNSAGNVIEGLTSFLLEEYYIDENKQIKYLDDELINFKSIKVLSNQGSIKEGQEVLLAKYIRKYRRATDNSTMKLMEFLTTAENTRGSIKSVFADKIDLAVLNENVMKITSTSNFDFYDFKNKKIALFMIVHDEKKTYYPLVSIFIKQLYEEIIKISRSEENLRLQIPLNILWDEFGISPALKDIDAILAASRSRGVRMNMVIQDFSQLEINYGHDISKLIKGNVMNLIYLLGGEDATLEEISKRCGNRYVWNKDKQQYEEVRIFSTDRLSRLSLGEAVIIRQRKNPFLTRYLPYNRFNFYKKNIKNSIPEDTNIPDKVKYFDLTKEMEDKKKRALERYKRKKEDIDMSSSFGEEVQQDDFKKDILVKSFRKDGE